MSGIAEGVNTSASFITNIILWFSNLFSKLITSIGVREIIIGVVILAIIYFYINQHSIDPKKVNQNF